MENNQLNQQQQQSFNNQQPQHQMPQQQQPFNQQPQHQMPQQQQPFNQQPQHQQPFNHQPQHQMGQQPVMPKPPMTMEKRITMLSFALLALFIFNRITSSHIIHFIDKNRALENTINFFFSIYLGAASLIPYIILIISVLLFVPKWNKYFTNYVNSRFLLIVLAATEIITSIIAYISLIIDTVKTSSKYSSTSYTPNLFHWDFFFIPIFIAIAVFIMILALKLPNNKLQKDRYVLGLGIISATLIGSGFISLLLGLFA